MKASTASVIKRSLSASAVALVLVLGVTTPSMGASPVPDGLLLREAGTGKVAALANEGGGGFDWDERHQLNAFGAPSVWVPLAGDFNDDGATDLLIRNHDTGEGAVAYNNGSGDLTWNGQYTTGTQGIGYGAVWKPFVGNFGGSSADDLLLRNSNTGQVLVLIKGSGNAFTWDWTTKLNAFGAPAVWIPVIGDFNADGYDDLLIRNHSPAANDRNSIAIAYSNSNGNGDLTWNGTYSEQRPWSAPSPLPTGAAWQVFPAKVRAAPSSHRYGGANRSVDSPAEASAFIQAYSSAATDGAARSAFNGLTLTDRRYVRSQSAWRNVSRGPAPLMRRIDPSFDDALKDPVRRPSIVQRATRLVAHDSAPAVSRDVTRWHSATDVYVNAIGVQNSTALTQANAWLLRNGGQLVWVDGWATLDLRQADARRWWRVGSDGVVSCHPERDQRGALDKLACGYDGLWLDNVLLSLSHFAPQPVGITGSQWADAVALSVQELRAEMAARGWTQAPIVGNMKWGDDEISRTTSTIDPNGPFGATAKLLDQVVLEEGALLPGASGFDAPSSGHYTLRRLLNYVDALHRLGASAQWEKTGSAGFDGISAAQDCNEQNRLNNIDFSRWQIGSPIWSNHVRTSEINLAAALLTIEEGDSVGDMCEYPDRAWTGYGEHGLGTPLAGRSDNNHMIQRRFSRGAVYLNTFGSPQTVTVPQSGRRIGTSTQFASGAVVSVPARTALIVAFN